MAKPDRRKSQRPNDSEGPSPWVVSAVSLLVVVAVCLVLLWLARKTGVSDIVNWMANWIQIIAFIVAPLSIVGAVVGPKIYKRFERWNKLRATRRNMSNKLDGFRIGDLECLSSSVQALLSHFEANREESPPNTARVVSELLRLRFAIDPVAKGVGNLSVEDAKRCGESIGIVSGAWANLLKQTASQNQTEARLILAFLDTYAKEEAADVGGNSSSDRHFIVTNFVAYSKLVQAVIKEAKDLSNKQLACRTALVLPLTRWFNFKHRPSKRFPYCEIHPDWEEYIQRQASLTSKEGIQVQRVVLSVEDQYQNQLQEHGLGFQTDECMKKHAKSWMLVPDSSAGYADVGALSYAQRTDILSSLGEEDPTVKLIQEIYDTKSAYLILPEDLISKQLPSFRQYRWERVWRVFRNAFHTHVDDCKYLKLIFKDDVAPMFINPPPGQGKMSEDFFLLGWVTKVGEEPDWFFCLAADVDPEMDRLTLDFITPSLSKARFHAVVRHAQSIWAKAECLSKAFQSDSCSVN
jgi:hypothetical protein